MKQLTRWTMGVIFLLTAESAAAPSVDAQNILDHVDDLYRGSSARATMRMKVVTKHWTRELEIETWSKGKERSLLRILSPKKEKGTATLKVERNIWNYLPKVRRVIKVPSSMMSGSWMGSHFTNDDLVRESRMTEDYTFKISFTGEKNGHDVIELTCTPREDAAVVWGRVVVQVKRNTFIPTHIEYFDEDYQLARTMTFGDVRELGGRRVPTQMRVIPADKPEEMTEVTYDKLDFDVDIDDNFFSLRQLRK